MSLMVGNDTEAIVLYLQKLLTDIDGRKINTSICCKKGHYNAIKTERKYDPRIHRMGLKIIIIRIMNISYLVNMLEK